MKVYFKKGKIMNPFFYTITAINEDIDDEDIYDVEVRLGECQHYSDTITDKMLRDAGIDAEKDTLNLFQLLHLVKKRKDLRVSFYCIKEKNRFHIYSDFFALEGAFSDAFAFFDDLDRVILLIEKRESEFIVAGIRCGEKIFQFPAKINGEKKIEHPLWQEKYQKMESPTDGLPSVADIAGTLDFLLQNSLKTERQMRKYLKENALFQDEYII